MKKSNLDALNVILESYRTITFINKPKQKNGFMLGVLDYSHSYAFGLFNVLITTILQEKNILAISILDFIMSFENVSDFQITCFKG